MCKLNSHALLCESVDDVPGAVRIARLYCRSNFLAARLAEPQSLSYHGSDWRTLHVVFVTWTRPSRIVVMTYNELCSIVNEDIVSFVYLCNDSLLGFDF